MSQGDYHHAGESSRRSQLGPGDEFKATGLHPGGAKRPVDLSGHRQHSMNTFMKQEYPNEPSSKDLDYRPFIVNEGASDAEIRARQEQTYRFLEARQRSQHLPDTSTWESVVLPAESSEDTSSIQDYARGDECEGNLKSQQVPLSAARVRVKITDMDEENRRQYMECLHGIHVPSKIRDGLYITNYETACFYLSGEGNRTEGYPKIGHVLSIINFDHPAVHMYDALKPADPEEFPESTTLLLDMKDESNVNMMELFPLIIKFLAGALEQGGTDEGQGKGVLVHCRQGQCRSPAAVLAYLTWAERKTPFMELWRQVVTSRICAWPNRGFWTQLCLWNFLDCRLTDEQGKERPYYSEYVLAHGLESAIVGQRADLTAHVGVKRPKPWPTKFLQG